MLFGDWIDEEAALIDSDGCSGVTNIQGRCCRQHDLEFFYGKSAADAYRLYRYGAVHYWTHAQSVTFEQANKHFRSCHFRNSPLGHLNPFGWWRYAVVRRKKGRAAWEAHRQREQEQSV